MKQVIITQLLQLVLRLILSDARLSQELLETAAESRLRGDKLFVRRGAIYRELKSKMPKCTAQTTLDMVTEVVKALDELKRK